MKQKISLIIMMMIVLGAGCRTSGSGEQKQDPAGGTGGIIQPNVPSNLVVFSSSQELETYLLSSNSLYGGGVDYVVPPSNTGNASNPGPVNASGSTNSNVTNNQEAGVDQGDIVKNYKDFLIVLQQGKLSSIQVGPTNTLDLVSSTSLPPQGLSNQVSYNELLINGNEAIVIGYRWGLASSNNPSPAYISTGMMEVQFFQISEQGNLTQQAVYFIESGDYYSWGNYSSQVVNNSLVFHGVYYPRSFLNNANALRLPQIYQLTGNGQLNALGNLIQPGQIFRPVGSGVNYPVLHSVVECDLSQIPQLSCQARSVVNSYASSFYVSPNRAYLWAGNTYTEGPGALYSFPLGTSTVQAVPVSGNTLDSFSMSESPTTLQVLVNNTAGTFFQCNSVGTSKVLLDISLDTFLKPFTSIVAGDYTATCLPNGYTRSNRFTPTHLVYGTQQTLQVVDRQTKQISQVTSPFNVTRFELAGNRLVVFGYDNQNSNQNGNTNVRLATLNLTGTPALSTNASLTAAFVAYGSRAYLYNNDGTTESFGLGAYEGRSTRNCGSAGSAGGGCYQSWTYIPKVSFFTIDNTGNLSLAGEVLAQTFTQAEPVCAASYCYSWTTGADRPIFLGSQVLSLLGTQVSAGSFNAAGSLVNDQYLNILTGEKL